MNKAYVLTGGNLGDTRINLQKAIDLIQKRAGKVIQHSAVYATAAWGIKEQPPFLNQALLVNTSLQAADFMEALLNIELEMGRKRGEKYGPRIIDLDILLFNSEIHHTQQITIPHPEMANRRFALTPLADIAGEIIHPVLHITINEMLQQCQDETDVKKLE